MGHSRSAFNLRSPRQLELQDSPGGFIPEPAFLAFAHMGRTLFSLRLMIRFTLEIQDRIVLQD